MMEKGVQIYNITGNHDDSSRKFAPSTVGNLKVVNQHYHNDPNDELTDEIKLPEERQLFQLLLKELVFANVF